MMKKLLNLVFIFIPVSLFSQTNSINVEWEKTYGGSNNDHLYTIIETYDGGYLLGGQTSSEDGDVHSNNGSFDFWVVKINNTGTIEWEKTYGGSDSDAIRCIIQSSDGGYILAGYSESSDGDVQSNNGTYDFWIVKIDSNGDLKWEKTYGGSQKDYLYSIVSTADQGFLLGGYTESNDGDIQSGNKGLVDFWLVKINETGLIEWEKTLGGDERDGLFSITKTDDEGYIIGGFTESSNGDVQSGNQGYDDYWVVKLNGSGEIEWEKTYGGSSRDYLHSIIPDQNNGYLLVGYSSSNNGDVQSGNHGGKDIWIVKINSTGSIEWEKTYGGAEGDRVWSAISTEGGYLLCGYTSSENGDVQSGNQGLYDYWIVKISNTGTIEWEKTMGGSERDEVYSSIPASDGGYIIGGYSWSMDGDVQGNHGKSDYWVVKISETNNIDESPNDIIKSYPNPAKDRLYVNLEDIQSDIEKILLFNSNGRLVYSTEGESLSSKSITIHTNNYKPGLYNLSIYFNKQILNKKVLIIQ